MAFSFLKRKKENKTAQEERKKNVKEVAIDRFLDNMSSYAAFHEHELKKLGIEIDEEQRSKLMNEYGVALTSIVDYLKAKFTDALVDGNNPVELDILDMEEAINNKAFSLLCDPQYPSIIDVKKDRYSTHFHIMNGKVTIAEYVHALPNLDHILATEKINNMFKDLTVEELAALLHQMRLLPKENDLDNTIENYRERLRIHRQFLYSVVYVILSTLSTSADIRRARLFADSFNIPFDFEPYESFIAEEQSKLNLTNC